MVPLCCSIPNDAEVNFIPKAEDRESLSDKRVW